MKRKIKKNITIRLQLLLIILPLAILPVIISSFFSANKIFSYLEDQNFNFYSTLLNQITNNMNFVYEQYARTLTNLVKIPEVVKGVEAPPYKNEIEENEVSTRIKGKYIIFQGNRVLSEGLRKTSEEKIDGDLFLYEMDRKSLINNTNYKVHQLNISIPPPVYENLINDPLFLKIKNDNSIKLIFGRLKDNVFKTRIEGITPVFIFPYYPVPPEKKEDTFTKFVLIQLFPNFIPKFYEDITYIKYGTLYILDDLNNIIAFNHPGINDYYNYDEEKKQYILGKDNPDDPAEKMSFYEYSLLNTDQNILLEKEVLNILNANQDDSDSLLYKKRFITYKNIKYLIICSISSISKIKLLFFLPVYQIKKPVYSVLKIIILVTVIIILLVIISSIITSKIFTNPIKLLYDGANEMSKGNYSIQLDTKKFNGEFFVLAESFNNMTKKISDYNEKLEEMVRIRTEQLTKANNKMKEELIMAQKIQLALIPKNFPEVKFLKFDGLYSPMEELGGDLYDVYSIDNNKICVVIVDVCGHGVPAALITSMAKISFISNSKSDKSVSEIVSKVNNEIYSVIGNVSYLTAFYCIIDLNTKAMEYTNAGHNELYVFRKDKSIINLPANSTLIGIGKDIIFESSKLFLQEGDKIIFYTDGIPETKNEEGIFFGYDRLKNIIIENFDLPAKKLNELILNEVNKYRGNHTVTDDITILIGEVTSDNIKFY